MRQVDYRPGAREMVTAEFDEAALGVPIVTVLPAINQVAFRLEFLRLSRGWADQALAFISARQRSIAVDHPRIARANLNRLRPMRPAATCTGLRQQMLSQACDNLKALARQVGVRTRPQYLRRIAARPDDFPVITTWLNAQWHCRWIASYQQMAPAGDRLDDLRDLLGSARCDAFVTQDADLRRIGPDLSPSRPCLTWDDLRARLV